MPNGARRRAAALGIGLAALALAGAPRAAAAQDGAGLTLDAVVARALRANPQINVVRARADALRGRVLAASGRFDTRVGASVSGQQQSAFEAGQSGLVASTSHTTSYGVEATRQLRSGITVQPRVTVSRTAFEGAPVVDAGSSVSLNVAVPLLRDRLGRASTSTERALRQRDGSAGDDVRQAAAAGVHQSVSAYWDYAAAHERLKVYVQAEARARRRLDETRTLVRGDERPAADLVALEAAVARAGQQRIAAEQAVDETRTQLGVYLGLDLAASAALPAPATPFPHAAPWTPDAAEEARLVRLGLERRGDLVATRSELRSDEILLEGAREELKPRLDLHLSVGYAGRQLGSGYRGLVEPLFQDVPGVNASMRVDWQFPPARNEARGAAAQAEAARAERALNVADLERRVAGGVSLTIQALRRSAAALVQADRAVALYRTTVDNEQQKNRLGAATLFDVTYAEDNLTSALLSVVAGRLAHAQALAQLRLETGTLAEATDAGPTVDPAVLTTRP
ncbi:MAG TPA: TolC family protein [Longimicrobium sp.]|nr:TolC family protein [Longimicrobium sp.]